MSDTGLCQQCEDAPQEQEMVLVIGGTPVGPVYVCDECAVNLEKQADT